MPLSSTPVYFGKFIVTNAVFHQTPYSFAFVNLKPLLPGHVLISPRRSVPRLSDLSAAEVTDLFLTVQKVGKTVERVFRASAFNLGMQDGLDAGQSVPHVHAHIIPRKAQDLPEDAIYSMMEGEDGNLGKQYWERSRPIIPKIDEAKRYPRSEQEMTEEADMLRREMDDEADGVKLMAQRDE